MIVPFQIENLTMDASRARQNLLDLVDKKAETLVKWFLSGSQDLVVEIDEI